MLNEEQWKNDPSKTCGKNELILNEERNETDIWSLSRPFTETDQKYFILIKCNTTIDISHGIYQVILTNGKNIFTEHFSNDERGNWEKFYSMNPWCFFRNIRVVYRECEYLSDHFSRYFQMHLWVLECLRSKWIELIYSDWSKVKIYFIIQLYLLAMVCSWLNSLISLIFTLMFALMGSDQTIPYRLFDFFARFFDFLAQILFLFTLIISVKGYFINRIQWRRKAMIQIQIFMLLYILIQIIILILITIVSGRLKNLRLCLFFRRWIRSFRMRIYYAFLIVFKWLCILWVVFGL